MSYEIVMRKNLTGEVKRITLNEDWCEPSEYLWTDGNYGCDCNRSDFWGENDDDAPCGETRFTVLRAILPDGTEVMLDDDLPEDDQRYELGSQ